MKSSPSKLRLDPEPTKKPARKVHRDAVPEAVLQTAQTERENAFDAEHTWPVWIEQKCCFQPVTLHGYSSGREALFYKLRAADGALPLSKTLEQLTTFLADAIKILWLCSHEPQEWRMVRGDLSLFLETIEAWGDVNVPRAKHVAAVNLALQIFNEAGINKAVPEPSERGDLGKLALPVSEAQYVAVIARGTGWTEDYIRWQLPLSRGRAYVHALRLMEGESMLWPDRSLSETGRWWMRVRNRLL